MLLQSPNTVAFFDFVWANLGNGEICFWTPKNHEESFYGGSYGVLLWSFSCPSTLENLESRAQATTLQPRSQSHRAVQLH